MDNHEAPDSHPAQTKTSSFSDSQHPSFGMHASHSAFANDLTRSQTLSSDDTLPPTETPDTSLIPPSSCPPVSPKSARSRQAHGTDHVKHHRVRSGCLVCRRRRVKCDENRPDCQRCLKGGRKCEYPPPPDPPRKRRARNGTPLVTTEIHQDLSPGGTPGVLRSARGSAIDEASSDTLSRSASEPDPRSPHTSHENTAQTTPSTIPEKWSHLPADLGFYLDHHVKHIAAYHYCQRFEDDPFYKGHLLEAAMTYEPLLYAVVAFSAYFHTLSVPDGKTHAFLRYYQKSVGLLRKSLRVMQKHSEAILLTILQLASIEELLGDWVNVVGHQHAAHSIITSRFTPNTMMRTAFHRNILSWYIRFDIFAGLMSGSETKLGRSWHVVIERFCAERVREDPLDTAAAVEKAVTRSRLFAVDVGTVFSRKAKGLISLTEFSTEIENLKRELQQYKDELASFFTLAPPFVQDFPNAPRKLEHDDLIMGATDPCFLLAGDRFVWNTIRLDQWGMELVFLGHMVQIDPSLDKMELVKLALRICKMFEALEYASTGRAIVLATHVSLAVAATVISAVPEYEMWFRRKFALIESCGYFYPRALRRKMCEFWSLGVNEWWLPDNEGFTNVLRAIRQLHDERAEDEKANARDDVRDMKGLFDAMSLQSDPDRSSEEPSEGSRTVSSKGTDLSLAITDASTWDDGQSLSDTLFPAPEIPLSMFGYENAR